MDIPQYVTYDDFAQVYDRYLAKKSLKVIPLLQQLCLSELPTGAKILDLCCGSGHIAKKLTELGFQVTGIDSSAEMLVLARKNADHVDFKLDDARTFNIPNLFDLVISMSDSLNHIMKKEELDFVFKNVYNSLRDGGTFIFDLTMEDGYQRNWKGYQSNIIDDSIVCAIATSYESPDKVGKFHATIFNRNDEWKRTDVTLYQRCYSRDELVSGLERAGFVDIDVYDAKKDFNIKAEGKNIFVTKKYVDWVK
ncbi:methyltransferase domain-containing protein [candidate division KSB1 bacterium]|nr:methyltransferase domain-containing protein [candidate division KSB1 bacterium]